MAIKFRKRALEELKSPEQLDQMLKITSPLSWLLLIALLVIVVVALLWGVYGSIPSRVNGRGLFLTKDNGLIDAVAYEYGKVVAIYVKEGQKVAKNQLVVRVTRQDLDQKISQLEKDVLVLTKEKAGVDTRFSDELSKTNVYVNKQTVAIQQVIDSRQKDLDYINSTIKQKELMVKQGYLTKDEMEQTYQKQREYTRDIAEANSSILKLQNSIQELQRLWGELRDRATRDLEERKLELEHALQDRETTENIKSPIDGKVVSVRVGVADEVTRGQPLVSILETADELNIVGFVPAEQEGRKVTLGMRALIEPAGIKREMYGAMIGKVSYVSEFPVSVDRLIAILHNEDLAKKIAATYSLLEVRISLLQMKNPKTGRLQYQWTSASGQRFIISPGTLCNFNITVETDPPITLVIPALKKLIGVYY